MSHAWSTPRYPVHLQRHRCSWWQHCWRVISPVCRWNLFIWFSDVLRNVEVCLVIDRFWEVECFCTPANCVLPKSHNQQSLPHRGIAMPCRLGHFHELRVHLCQRLQQRCNRFASIYPKSVRHHLQHVSVRHDLQHLLRLCHVLPSCRAFGSRRIPAKV